MRLSLISVFSFATLQVSKEQSDTFKVLWWNTCKFKGLYSTNLSRKCRGIIKTQREKWTKKVYNSQFMQRSIPQQGMVGTLGGRILYRVRLTPTLAVCLVSLTTVHQMPVEFLLSHCDDTTHSTLGRAAVQPLVKKPLVQEVILQ